MKTKRLKKLQQEVIGLSVEELQAKRKRVIRRERVFFLWGVHGTWIAALFVVPLLLLIHDYLGYNISVWVFISVYLLCYLPFSFLFVRGMRMSDVRLINNRLRELGSEPDVIN